MESKTRSKPMPSFGIRKRSDIDIMADILSEANRGTKKTHIMYKCNLSHKQLQVYLQLLLDMEFLMTPQKKENQKFDYFRTTPKGFEFIDAYRTLKGLMT
jgi:predicted transcriptional regulator